MTHVHIFAVTRQMPTSKVHDQGALCQTDHDCQRMNSHDAHSISAATTQHVSNESFNNVSFLCTNGVCRQQGEFGFSFNINLSEFMILIFA